MTLSEFATFSTALSGLAVTASLIYLALQTHQSVKHTKALIHQGRVANIMEMTSMLLNPELSALMLSKNGVEPTDEAIKDVQFGAMFSRIRFSWEDTYAQYRNGLLSADSFATTKERIVFNMKQPGIRATWELEKVRGTEFTAFVDAIIAALPASAAPPS